MWSLDWLRRPARKCLLPYQASLHKYGDYSDGGVRAAPGCCVATVGVVVWTPGLHASRRRLAQHRPRETDHSRYGNDRPFFPELLASNDPR